MEKTENSYRYIIAIGSNIEPKKNIKKVLEILNKEQKVVSISEFYGTKPVGYQNQANFLNGAVCIETSLNLQDLKAYLVRLENRLGRVKGPIKSGPRTMDLDIIICNDVVIDDDFYNAFYISKPVEELLQRLKITVVKK